MQRISGKDVEARLPSGARIFFEQVNINCDDGISATTDQGYPNGWVAGEVKGDGDIEVATEALLTLNEEAKIAGSWEAMEPFDLTFYAKVGALEMEVRAFGAKLRMPNFSFDGAGGEKLTHTINYVVSSPDFVHINGVPLANRPAA
jgi:hypothetical protein